MATISKRRGAYYLDFRDTAGTRVQRRFRTRAAAEDAFKRLVPGLAERSSRRRGLLGIDPRITLGAWGMHFLSKMAPPALKPRAWEAHRDAFHRFIEQGLGTIRLVDLRRSRIRDFLIAVQAKGRAHGDTPLAPGSVRVVYSALRAMLQMAVEDELIPGNPAARLGRTRGLRLEPTARERQQRVEERVPEANELHQLLVHTRTARAGRMWYPVLLTACRAGLRLGELAGLQIDDFNPFAPSLHVQRSVNKRTLALEEPKHGPRIVDLTLSPELVAVLRAHVAGLRRRALQTGQPLAPWLFVTRAGTPPEPRNIAHAMTRLCRQAGLPRRHSLHDLRHAYATLLVEAGAPLDYVQRQLGHASIQLTIDTYARGAKTKLPRHLVGALDTPRAMPDRAVPARSGDIVVTSRPRKGRRARTSP
jgi:integrase